MLRPVVGTAKGVRVDSDGTLHLPAGCDLLTHLYANHGVRVRMVRRPPKREKIPTVRQLIDDLAKKHENMLGTDLEIRSKSSSSTPTVPLSSSELLYGNGEGAGTSSHHGANDEVASGDVGGWDQRGNDRQKVKELELQGNKRPLSRNSTNRKTINFDKVSFDRDREDLRPIAGSVVVNKQSPLRANGIKTNLLRADQLLSQRSNGATGRDEDLVAMGTLWSPSHQLQARGTSTASTITTSSTSSSKSTSAPLNGNGVGIFNSSSGSVAGRRGINVNITNSTRPPLTHSSSVGTMGNIVKSNKDAEPKYSDPLSGATPTFQQRLMELAALEAETVRWERTKKVKKKPVKQEKDS